MPRYIDADKLKEHYSWWRDRYKEIFDDIVEQQPSADVRENIHGEWIRATDRYGINGEAVWKCSACSNMTICKGNFCHNCGADMRAKP